MGKQHPARNNLEAARMAVFLCVGVREDSQQANLQGHCASPLTGPGPLNLHVKADRIGIGVLFLPKGCNESVVPRFQEQRRWIGT